eukprot:TRINITY_DN3380_c0_g1_i1.p1 TRINITY_DN3380_c0_g1~~TRINITY_DN3380_c0_g1_i1.p1  ORF type:complete len:740 (+),score=106.26 TRINITY_DN3380_c0_g1_i1:115-2334(+)
MLCSPLCVGAQRTGDDGDVEFDSKLIEVVDEFKEDQLFLRNVFQGLLLTNLVSPVLFATHDRSNPNFFRSIEFLETISNCSTTTQVEEILRGLTPNEKEFFAVGIRDVVEKRPELAPNLVNVLSEPLVACSIRGMPISPHRTLHHTWPRLFKPDLLDEAHQHVLFTQRSNGEFLLGYADPRDISYHNYECILSLDHVFQHAELSIHNVQAHGDKIYTFELDRGPAFEALCSLDQKELYLPVANDDQRGGSRFIFSAAPLSHALSRVLADALPCCHSDSGFSHVNTVFRYNKFRPNDTKFSSHFDVHYVNKAECLVSKYTLLLYLSPGRADSDPILKIGEFELRNVDKPMGVIFDQALEHEGRPFLEADKIFVRSELIFRDPAIFETENPQLAKLFNIACYSARESLSTPAFRSYTSHLFNQLTQARYFGLSPPPPVLYHLKTLQGVVRNFYFITNGHDYYLPHVDDQGTVVFEPDRPLVRRQPATKADRDVPLRLAVLMILLDYFGGQVVKKVEEGESKTEAGALEYKAEPPRQACPKTNWRIQTIHSASSLDQLTDPYDRWGGQFFGQSLTSLDLAYARHFAAEHATEELYPEYERALRECDVLVMDQQVHVDFEDFDIEDVWEEEHENERGIKQRSGVIRFRKGLRSVINFAGCDCSKLVYTPRPSESCTLTGYNFPPIHFQSEGHLLHLSIDMFRNGFVVQRDFNPAGGSVSVPVQVGKCRHCSREFFAPQEQIAK